MPTVLHYTGYRTDRGGIVSVIRALHGTGRFRVVHGVSPEYVPTVTTDIAVWRGPAIEGERISLGTFWRARAVARAVGDWLNAEPDRVFHGHSRAGLLVALWLRWWNEPRVVVSVHCYGRQRWFYRWAARRLGSRLFWLTPEMRNYYGAVGREWEQCLPGGVAEQDFSVQCAVPVSGRLRLGGAGMLVRWKRWNLLLEALALLSPEIRARVSFEHIGAATDEPDSRAYAEELYRLAGTLGVAENVRWCGQEPSSHRLLSVADLLVVPSHHEPCAVIIQEAWAAGVPVLAADSGGSRDVVQAGQNGWLFRDGDARALADSLERRVCTGDWAGLDRTVIRRSARRATDVAAEWEKIYLQL